MSFIIYDLIFLYTYFVKIFCQNKIKKNCKCLSEFSLETLMRGWGKKY